MKTLLPNIKYAAYALLLLSPTFIGGRAEYFLLFVLAVFIGERSKIGEILLKVKEKPLDRKNNWFWLMILIFLLSLLNKVFNGQEIYGLKDYYSQFYLFPLLILTGMVVFNEKLFKFLIVFALIESFVGVIEYSFGVRSFFLQASQGNLIHDYHLFYNSRVFGLSTNSSTFAYKIFIAIVLLDYVKLKWKWNWLFRIMLTIGLLLSFSRIIFFLVVLYWLFVLSTQIIKQRKKAFHSPSLQFMFLFLFMNLLFYGQMKNQLARGDHEAESSFDDEVIYRVEPKTSEEKHAIQLLPGETDPAKQKIGDKLFSKFEKVQSSGRKLIWLNYINYIGDHWKFGNGSDKLMLRKWIPKYGKFKLIHAHNSYLQILAGNGIFISLLYFLFYILIWKARNFLPVLLFALYSLGNYGVFWGFSYMDLILIIFLTVNLKTAYDYEGKS